MRSGVSLNLNQKKNNKIKYLNFISTTSFFHFIFQYSSCVNAASVLIYIYIRFTWSDAIAHRKRKLSKEEITTALTFCKRKLNFSETKFNEKKQKQKCDPSFVDVYRLNMGIDAQGTEYTHTQTVWENRILMTFYFINSISIYWIGNKNTPANGEMRSHTRLNIISILNSIPWCITCAHIAHNRSIYNWFQTKSLNKVDWK